jgi:long-chain acyl-CoA synthetase
MRFVSILPTWHTFERTIEYIVLDSGIELHYSGKRTVRQDVLTIRPSFMVGVPRVWETFYRAVAGAVEKLPPRKRALVERALAGSREFHRLGRRANGVEIEPPARVVRPGLLARALLRLRQAPLLLHEILARKLVYAKLKAALGGELRIAISGGGPLPPDVDEFFVRAGLPFLNGYGLTETAPVVCVRLPERNVLGTIGPPLPRTEVRIVDEAGKDVGREVRGVIQVRGPQVMSGYFRNEAASRACLTADGWFDSGDLGLVSSEGDVMIVGRAKDTIVLTGGENVEPENIETSLLASPLILDVVVVGHARKTLGALIVPNIEIVRMRVSGLPEDAPEQIVSRPEVDVLIRSEVSRLVCGERGFRTFETVSRLAYLARPFSTEDGTLTATLKKRRRVIEERYQELIARLFD